jgi:hypothetical protein
MIRKSYLYHKPSAASLEKITMLRVAFSRMHDLIEGAAPASRERSCAITDLETAAMWAIKAVVINDPASEVETANVDQ